VGVFSEHSVTVYIDYANVKSR